MKGKLLIFAVTLLAVATIGVVQLQTKALDSSPDCDQFAVIWCGKYSMPAVRDAYDNGSKNSPNIAKIFTALGVSRADLNASAVEGVVYKDGSVKVGNRLVATDAKTAIRNMSGGNPIAGTNASIVPTSQMGDAQTALVVLDKNDNFLYAVMKPCGNPVKATPVKPPTPEPKPSAECKNLTIDKIDRTKHTYTATAAISNGATISAYAFETMHKGKIVKTDTIRTNNKQAKSNFNANEPGDYRVRVTVATSEGQKTGPDCVKEFTVAPEPTTPTPGVNITKLVNGKKSIRIGVDVAFEYQIAVKNTGDIALKNVLVKDTPETGVTLLSSGDKIGKITDNTWVYTIPNLAKGATMNFALRAKVPAYKADSIKNTVCVDAPEVPGSPDKCDEATVEVPTPPAPGKIEVCIIETKTIETILKSDFDSTKHTTDLSLCDETPVVPETPEEVPSELPTTGPVDTAVQLIGATSLAGALSYYMMSRRQQM